MMQLGIVENRELTKLRAVVDAGSAGAPIVGRAGAGELAGAAAEALARKGYVTIAEGTPRRAHMVAAGAQRLADLECRASELAAARRQPRISRSEAL